MARAKATEPQRSRTKSNAVDEVTRGIAKLRELSAQIDDLSRDGFPYREAGRARTELSFRETIRRLFGEKSPEYQAHKNHKLRVGSRIESAPTTTLIKELIAALENQKADLLGSPPAAPAAPPPTATARPALTAVPPMPPLNPRPTVDAVTPVSPAAVTMTNPPISVPIAMTTNLSQPIQGAAPIVITASVTAPLPPIPDNPVPLSQPILDTSNPCAPEQAASSLCGTTAVEPTSPTITKKEPDPLTTQSLPAAPAPTPSRSTAIIPSDVTTHAITETSPATVLTATPPKAQPISQEPQFPVSTPSPPPEPLSFYASEPPGTVASGSAVVTASARVAADFQLHAQSAAVPDIRTEPWPPRPSPLSAATSAPKAESSATTISDSTPVPSVPEAQEKASMQSPQAEGGTLDILRRICARFHLVARQLRLRKEYRPTLEIVDEYDLQDLFYALLRLQFDEVGTEEWSPPYADGARRTSYLLDWDRTVVVVKQTRSGLSSRDIAEQVRSDAAHYSTRPNGATLLCFIYDPEGRVGNPRGLEADLTAVSDAYTVEVIVAPK